MNRSELHRLLLSVKALQDAITATSKETVEAIAANAKAYQKANEPKPPGPPERVRNEVDFPPEVVNRYYSEEDKAYRLQRRTFWVGLLTLFALVAYTCVTYRQWRTMNVTYQAIREQTKAAIDTAKAAQVQTGLMQQQLDAQGAVVRCTVGVGLSKRQNRRTEFIDGVALNITNVGHATAFNVHVTASVNKQTIPDKQVMGVPLQIDFQVPRVEAPSVPIEARAMTRSYPFQLSSKEELLMDAANMSIVFKGTFDYNNGFGKTIREPFCYAYWIFYWREGPGTIGRSGGQTALSCEDFETVLPMILNERKQRHAMTEKED